MPKHNVYQTEWGTVHRKENLQGGNDEMNYTRGSIFWKMHKNTVQKCSEMKILENVQKLGY